MAKSAKGQGISRGRRYFGTLVLLLAFSCSRSAASSDEETGQRGGGGIWSPRPFVDPVREDDREDFDLAGVIALALSAIYHDIDALSTEDRQEYVDHHNIYKSNLTGPLPSGSDLQFYEYNNTLEWTAQEYLRKCIMGHGWADSDNMTSKQRQNLYQGPSRLASRAMYKFYMEWGWYYHNNYTCMKAPASERVPYVCAHYTAMMWHDTIHVGGARRSWCFPQAVYVIQCIHYMPGGNYVGAGHHFYRYGWRCERCPPGHLCSGTLCVTKRQCAAYGLDCECVLACKNCAEPDWKRCRCGTCKAGWTWEDCAHPCRNEYDFERRGLYCGAKSTAWCADRRYEYNCWHRCGRCAKLDKAAELGTCCGGKMCEAYYELDKETCECKLICPSFKCLFPPSTTTPTPPTTTTTTPTPPTTTTTTPISTTAKLSPRKKKKPPTSGARTTFRNVSPASLVLLLLLLYWCAVKAQ